MGVLVRRFRVDCFMDQVAIRRQCLSIQELSAASDGLEFQIVYLGIAELDTSVFLSVHRMWGELAS